MLSGAVFVRRYTSRKFYNKLTKTKTWNKFHSPEFLTLDNGRVNSRYFLCRVKIWKHSQSYLCLLILFPGLFPSPTADILDRSPSQEHHSFLHSTLTAAKTRCLLLKLNILLSSGIFFYFNRKQSESVLPSPRANLSIDGGEAWNASVTISRTVCTQKKNKKKRECNCLLMQRTENGSCQVDAAHKALERPLLLRRCNVACRRSTPRSLCLRDDPPRHDATLPLCPLLPPRPVWPRRPLVSPPPPLSLLPY